MKRSNILIIISSLILFTLLGCGISVPFLWDSSKVSVSKFGQTHIITVKDPEYTPANGYHISVMYAYCLTDLNERSSSSWWASFDKDSQVDKVNSVKFEFSSSNIHSQSKKDTTEYPIFMLSAKNAGGFENKGPFYILNEFNVKFIPNHPIKVSYSWDNQGFIVLTITGEDFEPLNYKLARSNGNSFYNYNFSQDDPEFHREKEKKEHTPGNNYLIHIMPLVYASSDNHPNQKFYISTGASVTMDTSDIHYSDGLDKEPTENEKDTI